MRSCKLVLMMIFALLALNPALKGDSALPEPGPEGRGLRFRLIIKPGPDPAVEGCEVRVDLINVSGETILLQATGWRSERHEGGFNEFVEAAVSMESYPPAEPWLGQVMAPQQGVIAEPEQELKPGETLSMQWRTTGRHLKNKTSNPLKVQNPEFAHNGLHSIHATLVVIAGGQRVQLRSNEQLVSFGGSLSMPKHTYGPLWGAYDKSRTAVLGLGSLQKVETGDRFLIRSGTIGMNWTLTITNVGSDNSIGTLQPSQTNPLPVFPMQGNYGALIGKNATQ